MGPSQMGYTDENAGAISFRYQTYITESHVGGKEAENGNFCLLLVQNLFILRYIKGRRVQKMTLLLTFGTIAQFITYFSHLVFLS